MGSTASCLTGDQNTTITFEVGPLDASSYSSLTLTFQYKAGSTNKTYWRKAYYKTASGNSYTELTVSGTQAAGSFNSQTASLPAAANAASTLYFKIEFLTSNTNPYVDEVELTGTAPTCTALGTINGSFFLHSTQTIISNNLSTILCLFS